MAQRFRTWLIWGALVVIGVIVGYALPQNSVAPKSEMGTVTSVQGTSPNLTVTFKTKGTSPVTFHLENPTPWQAKSGGTWFMHSSPSCLTQGAKVTLGVVTVDPVGSAPGGAMVTWVECYS